MGLRSLRLAARLRSVLVDLRLRFGGDVLELLGHFRAVLLDLASEDDAALHDALHDGPENRRTDGLEHGRGPCAQKENQNVWHGSLPTSVSVPRLVPTMRRKAHLRHIHVSLFFEYFGPVMSPSATSF